MKNQSQKVSVRKRSNNDIKIQADSLKEEEESTSGKRDRPLKTEIGNRGSMKISSIRKCRFQIYYNTGKGERASKIVLKDSFCALAVVGEIKNLS